MKRAIAALLLLAAAACAEPPGRIVSLSPNLTELLYGIGAFGQVAGVSDYCTYPPEVTRLPSVGGWLTPNLERLTLLRPDLVLVDEDQASYLQDSLHQLDLRLLVIPDRTTKDIFEAMVTLGRATGHEQEAVHLAAETHKALLHVSQKAAGLPRPSVVLIVNRAPGTLLGLYAATPGSFLAELVEIAGGRMVAPQQKGGFGAISKEELLALDPAVILDFVHGGKTGEGDALAVWRAMPELKAVRTGQVYGVNEDFVPHASQRIVQTAELFERLIHRAAAGKPRPWQ